MDPVAITISVLALAVSSTTAWLTLFRRGTVKMTQPTVIYFGPDAPRPGFSHSAPKVYLRTLLYATSKRGRVIECMYVSVARNESSQTFNVWVYGEDRLARGSGLFVGENGITANHHFLTPEDNRDFAFTSGRYKVRVHVKLVGDRHHLTLFSHELEVSRTDAERLSKPGHGIYYDWGPDSAGYLPHVKKQEPLLSPLSDI
jgi:hypothetical protein